MIAIGKAIAGILLILAKAFNSTGVLRLFLVSVMYLLGQGAIQLGSTAVQMIRYEGESATRSMAWYISDILEVGHSITGPAAVWIDYAFQTLHVNVLLGWVPTWIFCYGGVAAYRAIKQWIPTMAT